MALGGLGFGLYQILWTTALADTTAGTSSLLIATTPIFTMLLASVAGSDRIGRHRVAGAALSFVGVALVAAAGDGLGYDGRLAGELMTLAASLCWGVYLAFGSPFLRRHSPLLTTAWAMAGGSLVLAPLGLAQLATVDPSAITPTIVAAFAFSALLAAAAANVIVFRAVRLLGPTRVANFQFLVPAIAVALGALLLGERIFLGQVVGGAGIVAGILVARGAPAGVPGRSPAAIEAEQIEPA
jgi:drug/metabolite transporter (DMT)-like permease